MQDLLFKYVHAKITDIVYIFANLNKHGTRCLIDTGASIPVCCSKWVLDNVFTNASLVDKVTLRGFGGSGKPEPLYRVNSLCLGDMYNTCVFYSNFYFVFSERPEAGWSWEFLISASMLSRTVCTIDGVADSVIIRPREPVIGVRYDSKYKRVFTFAQGQH